MGRRDTKPGDELLSAGLLWTVCSALLSAAAAALFTTRLEYTPRGHVTALSLPLCQKQTRSCLLKEKKKEEKEKKMHYRSRKWCHCYLVTVKSSGSSHTGELRF